MVGINKYHLHRSPATVNNTMRLDQQTTIHETNIGFGIIKSVSAR